MRVDTDLQLSSRTCVVSVGPKTDGSLQQDKHVLEGGMMTIMCSLIEGDPPMSFDWTKDGQLVTTLPGLKVVNHDFSSILSIMAATVIHSGNYYCKASNPVSWSMMKATILVDGMVGCLDTSSFPLKSWFQGTLTCDIASGVNSPFSC